MRVPLLDLNAQNLLLEPELKAAFERVLHSGHFILGPEVQTFERSIGALVQAKHAIGVTSGTDAILLALMALGIGPGDEVLCPSFTFFATAGCIARTGATPVFVDSCPCCFNIDVEDATKKITSRTKAIMPVHLFGQSANMEGVLALAKAHNLRVIEDAAQALGAAYRGTPVGSLGDFGTYSFFPSKNLGGFGDGGLLVTNDDALAERASILRTHGSKPKYYHQFIGGNFRLAPLQAALLAVKLPHYADYTAKRRANAAFYTEQLSKLSGVAVGEFGETCAACRGLDPAAGVQVVLPSAHPVNSSIWNQYTLRVIGEGRRDALKNKLTELGVGTEIYYPVPMHEQKCFAHLGYKPSDLPISSRLARESLSIPIYPELSRTQQEHVVQSIASALAGK
jgi:dTDP-4-amino-4,6-dideoxygalactose transaminase